MPSVKRKDPCVPCFSDAMCTEMDIKTGKTKHTFIKEYKKEHRVMGWLFYLISSIRSSCVYPCLIHIRGSHFFNFFKFFRF